MLVNALNGSGVKPGPDAQQNIYRRRTILRQYQQPNDLSATLGRVYGGADNLIHVTDGQRGAMGQRVAEYASEQMRWQAVMDGNRTIAQAKEQALCPGCLMVVMFNATVALSRANGQSTKELARSMIGAYAKLLQAETCVDDKKDALIEEILVILDKD